MFLHTDLPQPSDEGQVLDRDVQLPPQTHGCSWTQDQEGEESVRTSLDQILFLIKDQTLTLILDQILILILEQVLSLILIQLLMLVLTLYPLSSATNRS